MLYHLILSPTDADTFNRNGYSIACVNEFISTDDVIENVNGTAPQSGVDIEPDTDSSSREGNGTPPQYSCLENSLDRGDW